MSFVLSSPSLRLHLVAGLRAPAHVPGVDHEEHGAHDAVGEGAAVAVVVVGLREPHALRVGLVVHERDGRGVGAERRAGEREPLRRRGSNASRIASPQRERVAAVVHLVEDHERAARHRELAVQRRPHRDLRVGDRDAVEVPGAPAVGVAEPRVEPDAGAGRGIRPLPLEVVGGRDDGDAVDDAPGAQLGGEAQGERGLAGARRRSGEEVARHARRGTARGPRPARRAACSRCPRRARSGNDGERCSAAEVPGWWPEGVAVLTGFEGSGGARHPRTGDRLGTMEGMVTQQHPWSRYVALGDSFTEGIGDPEPTVPGGHRGWADRVAEVLVAGHRGLRLREPRRARQAHPADHRRAARARARAAPRPHHDLGGRQRRHPAGHRPRRDLGAVRVRDRATLARPRDDRHLHRRRRRLLARVPRHPRQGRDLQREPAHHREEVRLHRRRPVGPHRDPGPAHVGARPAAPELARPPHGRAHGARRAQRRERPRADEARAAPHAAPGGRRASRTSSGRASTSCRGCSGASATSRRATSSRRSDRRPAPTRVAATERRRRRRARRGS